MKPTHKKVRMLVVEDEQLYSVLLQRYLEGLADEVNIVSDWKAAEKYIPTADIAWFDLIVPPDDADSSFIRIGEVRRQRQDMVIFVITGRPDNLSGESLRRRSAEAGADHFVHKLDLKSQTEIIALMIHALMTLSDRGTDVSLHLNKARQLLSERLKPEP